MKNLSNTETTLKKSAAYKKNVSEENKIGLQNPIKCLL